MALTLPAGDPGPRAAGPNAVSSSGATQALQDRALARLGVTQAQPTEARPAAPVAVQQAPARRPQQYRQQPHVQPRQAQPRARYVPPATRPAQEMPPAEAIQEPERLPAPSSGAPPDAQNAIIQRAKQMASDHYGARVDALTNQIAQLVTLLGSEREAVFNDDGRMIGSRIKPVKK